jgi:hypothetical protein
MALYAISLLLATNIQLARLFCVIIPLYCLYEHNLKDSPLFSKLKGLLVFVPILIYPFYQYIFSNNSTETPLFTILLALNIVLAGVLLGLNSDEKLSKINGIYLLILAILTPKLYYDSKTKNIMFTNNKLWGIVYSVLLTSTYLFNDFYYKMDWRYAGIYSNIIPTMHAIMFNDTSLWLPLRAYSLVITFLVMLKFPFIEQSLSEEINSKILWSTDKYDPIKSVASVAELIFTGLLIKQGPYGTIMEYFM